MEENIFEHKTNVFFDNVTPRFKSFKNKIKKLAQENKISFDEDVFMDTIIKCSNSFSNQNTTNSDIDNYFWTAFKQNSFSNFSRNKFREMMDIEDIGDDVENNIFTDEYNTDIDEITDLIRNEVKIKFGKDIYDAWMLHICNGCTYAELEKCGYKGLNLHNEFKQIKRYICQKFIIKNHKLNKLLKENNFIK